MTIKMHTESSKTELSSGGKHPFKVWRFFTSNSISILCPIRLQFYVQFDLNFTSNSTTIFLWCDVCRSQNKAANGTPPDISMATGTRDVNEKCNWIDVFFKPLNVHVCPQSTRLSMCSRSSSQVMTPERAKNIRRFDVARRESCSSSLITFMINSNSTLIKTKTKAKTQRVKQPTRERSAPPSQVPPLAFLLSFSFSFYFTFNLN